MYFPVSWPRYLNIPLDEDYKVLYITSNRERVVYCVVTGHEISIWYCKPCVQIVSHRRSDNSVSLLGSNKCAVWKPDSTCIAVVTDKGYVVFYKLEVDKSVGNSSLYQQLDSRSPSFRRDSAELFLSEKVPAFTLNPEFSVQTEGLVTSLVPIRDELVLCLDTGSVQRLKWDGTLNSDMCYGLGRVPFSVDQEHSRAEVLEGSGAHITHMEYSPLMAGFAVVLSDHRAAFLTAPTLKFEPTQMQAVWAQDLKLASCVAINHKYRLIAFGCLNAQGVVFVIDELTGGLNVSHRLVLSSKDYPDVQAIAGPVVCMQWSPDGCAVALAWRNGGLSLWSVFGSLLFCTLGGDYEMSQHLLDTSPLRVRSMEWGMEGYHLWMACEPPDGSSKGDLLQMNFLKSALTVNPCKSNHDHLFLQGEDRLLINTGDTIMRSSVYTTRTRHLTPPPGRSDSLLVGNKHWHVIQIPMTYLGNNWPIRYAAVDSSGNYAAVAGRSGFAHYALYSRKWKLFGNVTQEKDVVVTGGLTWWKDYIIMGCYNLNDYRDEIRVYPRASNLDNAHACIVRAMTQVLLLNIYRDTLISFCADSHIVLYSLAEVHKKSVVEVEVVQLQDVCISNIIPHPACVVSVSLTAVRKEIGTRYTQNSKDGESIILNVSGKLLMIQREHSKQDANDVKHRKQTTIQYDPPVMLASGVENIWISLWTSNEKRHLTEALWIGCGAQGMKVWLPLFPREGERPHNFMSKRIMLPFQLRIYPLAVLFEDAVVLGAETDTVMYGMQSLQPPKDDGATCRLHALPFCTVERTSQVYLHYILRQLLRRNLGFHALDIARSCNGLPYFPHVLELLLHQVLEEEATSSDPIPDPLLPRVVAFIEEFPEFLQTVVHCARKTEIALWHYLFTTVGNPTDLFQECLKTGKLETAASYLIILQNLEPIAISRQHATMLLDATLEAGQWELSKDITRFLRAIDPNEEETPPRTPLYSAAGSTVKYPSLSSPPVDGATFLFNNPALAGRGHATNVAGMLEEGATVVAEKQTRTKSEPRTIPVRGSLRGQSGSRDSLKERAGSETSCGGDGLFIDVILCRHARKLLTACRLRDLGTFAAHLDFHLVSWLRRERNRAAKIEDFVTTLKRLHEDFQWPYPVASPSLLQTFQRMSNSRKNESMVTMYSESDLSALLTEEDDDDDVLLASSNSFSFSAPHYLHTRGRDDAEMSPLDDASKTLEAFLEPQPMHFDSHSHGTTEDSSLAGEAEDVTVADDIQDACALEQWTQELATRGPPNMEVELRYLLQMVVEAGCFEWALLLTVLLRDALAVSRVARAATAPDVPTDVIARSRDGLAFLELWAKTVCLGYRPFVALIRQQAMMLERCVASRPRPRRTPSPPLLETTNSEDAAPLSTSAASAAAGATYEHALLDDDDDDVVVGAAGEAREEEGEEEEAEEEEENLGSENQCCVS